MPETNIEPFTTSAVETARYLKASTGLSSRVIAYTLGMTARSFSALLVGQVDSVPVEEWNVKARKVYETFKMREPVESLGQGSYYADLRPKRRDGLPIVAVEKIKANKKAV